MRAATREGASATVRELLRSGLLLVTGTAVLRVSLVSDICLRYVKPGMQPLLVATGFVLVAGGLLGVHRAEQAAARRRATRQDPPPARDGHDHEHEHEHTPRVAWLLLLPALALLLFAPPALGSYTASRDTAAPVEEYEEFAPLPRQGAVPLTLTEFTARVRQDEERSLAGRTVVMQGFVTPRADGTWDLSRLLIACCAADARTLTVTVHGAAAPPADTWVRVTGAWHPGGTFGTAGAAVALDVTEVVPTPAPPLPYLDRAPEPDPAEDAGA